MSVRRALLCVAIAALASPAMASAQTRPSKPASKLDPALRRLADRPAQPRAFGGREQATRADRVAVTIRSGRGRRADAVAALTAAGGQVVNALDGVIEAYVPVAALRGLERAGAVVSIAPIVPPQERAVSQGVVVHNAVRWNADGLVGAGMKVGIIDSFAGYASLVGSELPAPAGVRCYTYFGVFDSNLANCGGSSHGTAVAEALVDVAPAASLYLANPISPLDLRATVAWMADNGVRVINYSQNMSWEGPGDGTSPFADSALATVEFAVSRGITFVMAAGNEQRATWTGAFQDRNGDDLLEFSGDDRFNTVFLFAGQRIVFQVRWQDSWSAASRDLDLWVYDEFYNLIDFSDSAQSGAPGQIPREIVSFVAPHSGAYHFAIERFSGAIPAWVQAQAFTGQSLSYPQHGWSIGNPGDSRSPGMLAVGASHWNRTDVIAPYSSVGPTIDGRVKPDIVGVASADSATMGPGGFAGTSQASPHVAGLAALVLQAHPTFSPAQVAAYLKQRAQPRGDSPNNSWGAGLAFLPELCAFSVPTASQRFALNGGTGTIAVNTAASCSWAASTTVPWISITGGLSAAGSGVVQFSVQANTGGTPRQGTLIVAGSSITIAQSGPIVHPSPHDLNGDGTLDLFWQHDTEGWVAVWQMNQLNLVQARLTTPERVADTNWKIVGSGDFNGDSKPDLFWQHRTTGVMTVWYMDGATFVGAGLLSNNSVSDADWQIRAIADLSGDGKPDLIWQHRTQGYVAAWIMDGVRLVEARLLSPGRVADLSWKIAGTGDFNGDGRTDLFWRHQQTGLMTVWFMNGLTFSAAGMLSHNVVTDLKWEIRAIADINDDGRPDLLWQHRDEGFLNVWLMDGVNLITGAALEPRRVTDTNWRIAGPR